MIENVQNAGVGETQYTRFDTAVADEAVSWIENEAGRSGEPWCLWGLIRDPALSVCIPERVFRPLSRRRGGMADQRFRPRLARSPGGEKRAASEHFDSGRGVRRGNRAAGDRRLLRTRYLHGLADRQGARGAGTRRADGIEPESCTQAITGKCWATSDSGARAACTRRRRPCRWSLRDLKSRKGRWSSSPSRLSTAIRRYCTPLASSGKRPTAIFPAPLYGTSRPAAAGAGTSRYSANITRSTRRMPSTCFAIRATNTFYHAGGYPPQLFDMRNDPLEQRDLGQDPNFRETVNEFESRLREILDPEEVDRLAKADQQSRLRAHGGVEKILRQGLKINFSPTPPEFQ